jgi:dUTP pyrophosphatase
MSESGIVPGEGILSKEYRYEDLSVFPVNITPLREGVIIPKKGSLQAAGYDLVAVEDVTIHVGEITKIPLGFATALHPDIHCRIESRSGMALKGAVVVTGVIDADYRGEWNVIMINLGKSVLNIAKGDRVAQAVFRPTVRAHFEPTVELSETRRGVGGFGSTGR